MDDKKDEFAHPLDDPLTLGRLSDLERESDVLMREMKQLLPKLAEARRRYMKTRNKIDGKNVRDIESAAEALNSRIGEITNEMQKVAGIPDSVLKEFELERRTGDRKSLMRRRQLTASEVQTTGTIEELLKRSSEKFVSAIDPAWLKEIEGLSHGIAPEFFEEPLSLVRGLRRESEFPRIHRFAQAFLVMQDFLNDEISYDHFAGSLLLPQMAALADRMDALEEVGGPVKERFSALWRGPSEESDAVAFELLVAAGCASRGRAVEFLRPQSEPTPDLRCHDPYPLVIECKRKRSLTEYEVREEQVMKVIFMKLAAAASKQGLWGCFQLDLLIEADSVPQDEVVACLMRQRLAPNTERPISYEWGRVSFRELPRRGTIQKTRLYSPTMLGAVFGWNSDLPEWDGIVCRVKSDREMVIEAIEEPVALLWRNTAEHAIKKRSWGPSGIVGEAVGQIPRGEFGLVYAAYQEGTREEIADRRTDGTMERLQAMTHSASIRVPHCFLVRLYPRALGDGKPDLIESTVCLTAEYGEPSMVNQFPGAVFTKS